MLFIRALSMQYSRHLPFIYDRCKPNNTKIKLGFRAHLLSEYGTEILIVKLLKSNPNFGS